MLDNIALDELSRLVGHRPRPAAGACVLEASGTIRIDTVRAVAETGVDLISTQRAHGRAPRRWTSGLDFV